MDVAASVGVLVAVGVGVSVADAVAVGVRVGVWVGVLVGVKVIVGVAVRVIVGVALDTSAIRVPDSANARKAPPNTRAMLNRAMKTLTSKRRRAIKCSRPPQPIRWKTPAGAH